MITLAREGRLGYMTGPVWLSGLGEGKWLGSSEDLIKLYGWDGEGQDHFNMKRSADGKQTVGQCPVNHSLPPVRILVLVLSLHFTMSTS